MRDYSLTIAANSQQPIQTNGNFIKVKSATVELRVIALSLGGKQVADLLMGEGAYARLPDEFIQVVVENPTGSTTTASLIIGNGVVDDSQLSGNVTINQGATLTQSAHTVGIAAAVLLAADSTRKSVIIQNRDAANSIYLGDATVTTVNGLEVAAGREITLDKAVAAAIYAIGAATGIDVRTLEEAA